MSLSHKEAVSSILEAAVIYAMNNQITKEEIRQLLEDLLMEDEPEIPCVVDTFEDAVRIVLRDIQTAIDETAAGPVESKHLDFGVHQDGPAPVSMWADWPGEDTHHCVKYIITPIGDQSEVTCISHIHCLASCGVEVQVRS